MTEENLPVNRVSPAAGFNHSFDVGIAMECGVEAAIVYNNLVYWIMHNYVEGINFHKGTTWTYNTPEKMQIHIPYLTPRQIKYGLQKLFESGIIIKDNFNKDKFDKTNWYALADSSIIEKSKKAYEASYFVNRSTKSTPSIEQICPIDKTNLSNPHNTYTIPTNTLNNTPIVPNGEVAIAPEGSVVNSLTEKIPDKPKRIRTPAAFSPKVKEVADRLINILMEKNPVYRPPHDLTKFLTHVQHLVEKDKQDVEILIKTFEWAASDNEERSGFKGWQGVICSTNPAETFRKHFAKIHSQMCSQPKRRFAPCGDRAESLKKWEEASKDAI